MPSAAPTTVAHKTATTRPLQAAILLSALYFLGRFTGLFQRVVIAALLHRNETDAYAVAFDLPDYLNYLVAGGALSSTFIPIFTRMWSRGREADAWRFFSTLTTVMGSVLVVLTTLMMLFTPFFMGLTKPGLLAPDKADVFRLAVEMTRIILPAQLCFYLGGLYVGVLNTFKRFGATGWTGTVYNLVAIGVAVPAFYITRNPLMFAWGILIGAFIGNFLLPYNAAQNGPRSQRPRFAFRFAPGDPNVKRFFILALPIMFGVSLPVVDQWVVGYFASSMPKGILTYLSNSNRLMLALQAIVGQAAAVAAFPYLATEGASGEYVAFAAIIRTGLRRLLFLTLPLTVLMILWARPLVDLVFGWGAFRNPVALGQTSAAFAFYSVGLFAWAGQGFIARGFYALGDTRTPTILGSALTVLFFIPLCAIAARTGVAANLALATTIGAAIYFYTILVALENKISRRRYDAPIYLERVAGTLLRTICACGVMSICGLVAMAMGSHLLRHGKLGDLAAMIWVGAIASVAFTAAAERFDIPEWNWLRDKVGGRLKRRRRRALPQ